MLFSVAALFEASENEMVAVLSKEQKFLKENE